MDSIRLGRRFSRPYGTGPRIAISPGVETPGYYQASLRDAKTLCHLSRLSAFAALHLFYYAAHFVTSL
jgi:hypothetical protein